MVVDRASGLHDIPILDESREGLVHRPLGPLVAIWRAGVLGERRVADILREIENSYTEPEAVQGIAVQIPTGPGGVYAIELWSKVGAYPVRAESTDGKVVHVLPPGRRAVCSPTFGGQGWFRPKGNGEILIGYPGNFPGARVIAFDPSGRIAGASQIHSTRLVETNVGPRQQPVGKPCRFQPDPNAQGLYSFITANNDWHAEG